MKAMKKLVPAFCLLLISAVLMGTSTYAWFSMNTSVSATGMKVKATVPRSLSISNNSTGTYGTSASALKNTDVVELSPASTADTTNWFAPIKNATGIDATDGTYADTTIFQQLKLDTTGLIKSNNENDDSDYGRYDSFYVKATEKGLNGLYIKNITVNNNTPNAITKALRVAVKCGDKVLYFTVTDGTTVHDKTKNPIKSLTSDNKPEESASALTISPKDGTAVLLARTNEISTTTATEVTVYIWYDGQDGNCTTSNAISVQEVTVTVEFGCWEGATAPAAG